MKKMVAYVLCLALMLLLFIPKSETAFDGAAASAEDVQTTTTTAVECYTTQVSCSRFDMVVGQMRSLRAYHPATGVCSGLVISEVSDNIAVSCDDNSGAIHVSALASGKASFYVREKDCAFGTTVSLNIIAADRRAIVGDANNDLVINLRDVLVVYQAASGRTALSRNQLMGANYIWDTKIDTRDALALYQYVSDDRMAPTAASNISFTTLGFAEGFGAPQSHGGRVTVVRNKEEWDAIEELGYQPSIKSQGFNFDAEYFKTKSLVYVECFAPREAMYGFEVTNLSVRGTTLNTETLLTYQNGYTIMLYWGCLLLEVDASAVADVADTAYRYNDAWLYGYSIVIEGVEV